MRLDPPLDTGGIAPQWLNDLKIGSRPLVYVSLGTHAYFSRPEFFQIILEALATLEIDVIVTIGEHNQTSALTHLPENVHVEQWLPLSAVLPHCTMVVCHGGSGTVLAALGSSLPLLLLPRGADQFENAAACARAGAARVLPAEALAPATIMTEVQHILAHDSYSQAAARLHAEIEDMPAPSSVVPLLESLANGHISRTELGATAVVDRN
jgi:MGT family glycosyltransferase